VDKEKEDLINEKANRKTDLYMKHWWSVMLGDSDEDKLDMYIRSFNRKSAFKSSKLKYLKNIIKYKTRIILKKYCE